MNNNNSQNLQTTASKENTDNVLELVNIVKNYGKIEALKNLSLSLKKSEILSILGPSGAGKTTILKVIAGLEQVQAGKIIFKDTVINNLEPKERNVAMVFETYALYPHISVYENLASSLHALKMPKDEINKRVERISEILGMKPYLDRKPANLSGGQKQRVSLGRALTKPADLFLMDEPIAHLDAKLRFQMIAEFKKIQYSLKISMIYVTHDWREALSLGNHVIVLNNGIIEQYGTSEEIFFKPNNVFVTQVVGDPQMNIMPGLMDYKDNNYFLKLYGLEINLNEKIGDINPGEEIFLGIRPNKISFVSDQNKDVINVEIYSVEKYGVNTVNSFKISNNIYKNIFVGRHEYKIGEKINIKLDLDGACLFDKNKKLIHIIGRHRG
jgi:multiple sugar transport system ATP-binding protein